MGGPDTGVAGFRAIQGAWHTFAINVGSVLVLRQRARRML
jgi:hypothetical protein